PAATQRISATGAIRNGVLPIDGTELFIDALDLVAEDLEVGPRPRGTARVEATRLRYRDRTLVEGTVTAAGDGRLWNIATKLDVRGGEPILVDAAGTVLPGPPIEINLARALGSVGDVALELLDPASLRLASTDATQWSTGPIALRIGESGRLDGQAAATNGRTRIDAKASGLPLTIVSLFSPELDLEGTVDGKLQLEGSTLANASGELSLLGQGVASHGLEDQGISPVDVQAEARLGSGRVKGTVTLEGLSETRLALTLDAPLEAASGSAPFVAGLVWKGNLAEALALLPLGEDSLTGRIDADLELTGTIDSPRVTGRAVIDGGQWEQAASGLLLRDIHAEFEGSGTSLTMTTLTATDGEQGRISANGRLRFGTLPGFDAQFDLEASDAMLARLDIVTARADATLSLTALRTAEPGADIDGAITGKVQIEEARIEIPARFVSDIPEIDVIVVGTETDAAAAAVSGKTALRLDVAVEANNRIFVTGRGLESEWASDLHVRGTTSEPRIEGKITSVRGDLSLLGRRFEVSSATLLFDGRKDNVPWLTMTARAEANDITAIADVSGLATLPVIELRSEPSLPRDEVLSRVLFGQSAANLTPLQSVQLARSVAELAGSPLGGGGGMLTGVGRTLGFDSLGIESSGSDGAAALTASKYLTDNVYLRVQGGLTPESSRLSLEWKVFKNITIESDVSPDAQGEVGATWRWDY
ncbi:MAG: translocation/assembly module TamB domain-containing protein, partial [Candidatus Binatia bacterium]